MIQLSRHDAEEIIARAALVIPSHANSFRGYLLRLYPPGDGVAAVLKNDLMGAMSRCDIETVKSLSSFVYNHVPANLCGSAAAFDEWVAEGEVVG